MGCDLQPQPRSPARDISIHAPTWGATRLSADTWVVLTFQSTHPRGVRLASSVALIISSRFQSTHPRGVRRWPRTRPGSMRYFNPRTHVGCDIIEMSMSPVTRLFQSTHPRGVRPFDSFASHGIGHFNPRTHVGCDDADGGAHVRHREISIHAPTWGATFSHARGITHRLRISIHAPTWGATYFCHSVVLFSPISIHAPTWGATVKPSNGWLLGHKDNEFANENIIIINSVNIT